MSEPQLHAVIFLGALTFGLFLGFTSCAALMLRDRDPQ